MALFERLLESRAISPQTLFRTGADTLDLISHAGVSVTQDTALTYSGIWACVRLIASDISTLPVDAYRKVGESRVQLDNQPSWIDTPDPDDPSITHIDHFAQVAVSLLLDGNAFVLATPDVVNPIRLEVLNPRAVDVKKSHRVPEYRLRDGRGQLGQVLGPLDIIHVKINAKPGALRGMSPIEANQGSIGISLAAQKWVERFFGQGAMMPGFVTVPVGSQTSVDELASDLQKRHGGWRRSGLLGILTGGAEFKASGITPRDAELNAIFNHQLEEGARIYGIPPFMVGSQEPAGVAYASSVERAQHYIDHCLMHYIKPIEVAYTRLVPGDRRLLTPGSDTYMKFNVNALLRGDPAARSAFYRSQWEIGALNADEIRAAEERAPLPDKQGETYYYPSANFSPVGTVPNPPAPAPSAPPAPSEVAKP